MHKDVGVLARGGAGACVVAIVCAAAAGPASAGCTTHQCDASFQDYFGGEMIDENTYETSPIFDPAEQWIHYPANVTLTVHFSPNGGSIGRTPVSVDSYVGVADPSAMCPGCPTNWTEVAGQLAEFAVLDSDRLTVLNATCADYYARFVVHFQPLPPPPTGGDASADAPGN